MGTVGEIINSNHTEKTALEDKWHLDHMKQHMLCLLSSAVEMPRHLALFLQENYPQLQVLLHLFTDK